MDLCNCGFHTKIPHIDGSAIPTQCCSPGHATYQHPSCPGSRPAVPGCGQLSPVAASHVVLSLAQMAFENEARGLGDSESRE